MDMKQLRAFITVLETGNLTKAASILNIVQPALTRQIHILEEELGVELFIRSKLGMLPTAEAKALEEYARRILKEVETAKTALMVKDGQIKGAIHIGIIASLNELISVSLIRLIKEQYPDVKIKIFVGYSGLIKKWLENGDIDFAILYNAIPSKFIDSQKMVHEKLVLIGSVTSMSSHFLNKPLVSLQDIANLPLILPTDSHQLRYLIEHGFQTENLNINIVVEVNDLTLQIELAQQGVGFTVLPLVCIQSELGKSLSYIEIDHPQFCRDIALALPNTRQTTKLLRLVSELTRDYCYKLVENNRWLGAQKL